VDNLLINGTGITEHFWKEVKIHTTKYYVQ